MNIEDQIQFQSYGEHFQCQNFRLYECARVRFKTYESSTFFSRVRQTQAD